MDNSLAMHILDTTDQLGPDAINLQLRDIPRFDQIVEHALGVSINQNIHQCSTP